jgi:hypothetical protein
LRDELNGFGIDIIKLDNYTEEKLSKEERKARHDATISKLTAIDTSNDIFNFNFDVADNLKPLVQKKFGETMEKFLKNIDYSDKYAIRYQFNDRWRRLPLDDQTGVRFYDQLKKESFIDNQKINNSIYYEDLYDFFPVRIA